MKIELSDQEQDIIIIDDETEDYLCYISVNQGSLFGCSPSHAHNIIKRLTELLEATL